MSLAGPKTSPVASSPSSKAPRIELPSAKQDRAFTGKVGIVAVAGFVVGMAWPRLLGVQVGPDVPGNAPVGRTPPSASAPAKAASAPASVAATPEPAASAGPDDDTSPTNKQQVVVSDGEIVGCKNKKNDKLSDCGKLAFDRMAKPRLAELSRCRSAIGLSGTLTIGVAVNFDKDEITVVDADKKKGDLDAPSSTMTGVRSCAATELKGLELDKLGHTHPRYTIVYQLAFYPPGTSPPQPGEDGAQDGGDEASAGLGKATVTWEKALLRDSPKEGKVKIRVPQGTRVKILEQKDDWYLVETSKGKGWVYRQAIGK
ncbi:MAG: SH3 domain-containing protein [Polyangiaceae bacterium]